MRFIPREKFMFEKSFYNISNFKDSRDSFFITIAIGCDSVLLFWMELTIHDSQICDNKYLCFTISFFAKISILTILFYELKNVNFV